MGLFSRKKGSLDDAEKLLNGEGFMGKLTKSFLGKETTESMNSALDQAKMMEASSNGNFLESGVGTVTKVVDTGQLINFNPVLILNLDVAFNDGRTEVIQITGCISKVEIPRIGDMVSIGNHPTIEGQYVYIGLKQ